MTASDAVPCSTLGIQPLPCSTHHIQPLLHCMQEETYAQNFAPPIYTLAVPPCCITCVLNFAPGLLAPLLFRPPPRFIYSRYFDSHALWRRSVPAHLSLASLSSLSCLPAGPPLSPASLRSLPAFSHACMRRVKGCRRGFGGGVSGASRRHYSVAEGLIH